MPCLYGVIRTPSPVAPGLGLVLAGLLLGLAGGVAFRAGDLGLLGGQFDVPLAGIARSDVADSAIDFISSCHFNHFSFSFEVSSGRGCSDERFGWRAQYSARTTPGDGLVWQVATLAPSESRAGRI